MVSRINVKKEMRYINISFTNLKKYRPKDLLVSYCYTFNKLLVKFNK